MAEKNPKKSLKRKFLIPPEFMVEPDHVGSKISIGDLRDLSLYILVDSGPPAPKWISIRNRTFIKHTVVLLIPGLESTKFGISSSKQSKPIELESLTTPISFFKDHFTHVWPTHSPGTNDKLYSPVGQFMAVPLNKSEKKQMEREYKASKAANKGLKAEDLLLTYSQMLEQGYPIHKDVSVSDNEITNGLSSSDSNNSQWVQTINLPHSSRIFAIDCEMCDTRLGKELTRVTVVDTNGNVILDELVKPYEQIVDYLTQYSGITEELLENISTRLSDIQEKLLTIISCNDIILGHSLESDLIALRLKHPKIIDTAILFQHPKGVTWKPALRWLTSKFLNREIQNHGSKGHDSVEDALACVDLLNAKLKNGIDFGITKRTTMNFVKKLANNEPPKSVGIADYGVPHYHEEYAKSVISCSSDEEIVENVIKLSQTNDFVWGRFKELEKANGWGYNQERSGDEEVEMAYKTLNKNLKKLYNKLPNNTALIIMSGSGDPREMSRLRVVKEQFQKEYKIKKWDKIEVEWTEAENQQLNRAAEVARSGISFLTVKTIDNENGIAKVPSGEVPHPTLTIGSKAAAEEGNRTKRSRSETPHNG